MLHELRAANAIACDIRFRRAHLNRVEEAHPAVRDRLEVGQ
jgi:hypothetical protein